MYVKGKGKGNVKGAAGKVGWKDKGKGDGKDGKANNGEFNGKCKQCGHIGHPECVCPSKNADTIAAHVVTEADAAWSLMLNDEPPPQMPTLKASDVNACHGVSRTPVGARSSPTLPVMQQKDATLTGPTHFNALHIDEEDCPEPSVQDIPKPSTPKTVTPPLRLKPRRWWNRQRSMSWPDARRKRNRVPQSSPVQTSTPQRARNP